MEAAGECISAKEVDFILPDPTDLPFLEVAMAGVADALVTGNLKHIQTEARPTQRGRVHAWGVPSTNHVILATNRAGRKQSFRPFLTPCFDKPRLLLPSPLR
jgi:hypothetical protein